MHVKRSSAWVDWSTIYTADTHERDERSTSLLFFFYLIWWCQCRGCTCDSNTEYLRVLLLLSLLYVLLLLFYYYHHSRRTSRARPIGRKQWRLVVVVVGFPTTTWGMVSGGSDERTRFCRWSPPSSLGDVTVTRGWWFTTTTTYSFTKLSTRRTDRSKKKNHPCTLETPPPLNESRKRWFHTTRYTPPPDTKMVLYIAEGGGRK